VKAGDILLNPDEFCFSGDKPIFRQITIASIEKNGIYIKIHPLNERVLVYKYFKNKKYFFQYIRDQKILKIKKNIGNCRVLKHEADLLNKMIQGGSL
jgi:hypothetical protein